MPPTDPTAEPTLAEVRLLADTYKAIRIIEKTLPGNLAPEEKEREAMTRFEAEMKSASAMPGNGAFMELHRRLEQKFTQEGAEFPLDQRVDLGTFTGEAARSARESVSDLPESEQASASAGKLYGSMRDWITRNGLSESSAFVWATAVGHAYAGEKAPPLALATGLTAAETRVHVEGLPGLLRDQRMLRSGVQIVENAVTNSHPNSMRELAERAVIAGAVETARGHLDGMRMEVDQTAQQNLDRIFRERLINSNQQAQIATAARGPANQSAGPSNSETSAVSQAAARPARSASVGSNSSRRSR
ncbi:hypothetical protein ABT030_52720 [Streptomyces mirabilis]|uniref:hypothetical protein n=1 Tax=Streptomyces mirabilis TaxID=68239 RepID=UPI003331BE49